MMKWSILALSCLAVSSTYAFSPVAQTPAGSGTVPSAESIDRSLRDIDSTAKHDVYDPLGGSNPPLTRNNNDQVWVPQVGRMDFVFMLRSLPFESFTSHISFFQSVLVPVETENQRPCVKWSEKTLFFPPTLFTRCLSMMKRSTLLYLPCLVVFAILWTPCCERLVMLGNTV